MDNKITKRRLSDFLAYEWIAVIAVCIAFIVLWEFIYSVGSVRLSIGQEFKYYFDTTVTGNGSSLSKLIIDKQGLSYDVQKFSNEQLLEDYNVLDTRLSIKEGDVLITDAKPQGEQTDDKAPFVSVKSYIDKYSGYAFDVMLSDAKSYIKDNFMVDGVDGGTAFCAYDENNLSIDKIKSVFLNRMKKDNRFRTDEQKELGVLYEKDRIIKLYKEVIAFEKLLSYKTAKPELFINYTLYEQSMLYADGEENKNFYKGMYDSEIEKGRGNLVYALNLGELSNHNPNGDKNNPSTYFTYQGSAEAKDVCIMVFDFKADQPHLQYEAISFINTIVRDCSNLLD